MFEKEAEEQANKKYPIPLCWDSIHLARNTKYEEGFQDGAEFGYNKANEWHYVKDGDLPPDDTKVLALMAEKEICIAHFYRRNVWDKIGTVIAWKEIVPPKECEK